MHESEVAQSCPTLSDPMDCSPQASLSMGFSRQEYWSGVPLRSLSGISAAAAAKLLQLCLTLCDPIDGSPSGSTIYGILQARVLEWGTIAFSQGYLSMPISHRVPAHPIILHLHVFGANPSAWNSPPLYKSLFYSTSIKVKSCSFFKAQF